MISPRDLRLWVMSDLDAIVAQVQQAGAKLMLQTYMPEKFGPEKPVDSVIRKVALGKSLPLSDTSAHFFRVEPDYIKRKRFFTAWYGEFDNHLGENGYAVIAELLEADFEKFGWIAPR